MLVSTIPTFPSNSALAEGLRVKLSGGFLVVAGASDDELGTLEQRVLATDTTAAVLPIDYPGVRHMVAAGSFSANAQVYAAANGKIDDSGTLERGIALDASSGDGAVVRVLTMRASVAGDIERSQLVQDDLAVYGLELDRWQATDNAMAKLGGTAGTPSGAFGITPGTHGTAPPKIVGEAASGNSKTDKARRLVTLPPEYVAGETVTLRVRCKEAVGAATAATSIDAEVFKLDKDGAIGSDLCATAAQDVTESAGNKDFTITPTGLAPGDVLDIELTGVTNDTGGTVGTVLEIYDIALLLDIQG